MPWPKGKPRAESTKAKLRGKTHSEEHKQQISSTLKERFRNGAKPTILCGAANGMFGKHHTEEAKNKVSQANTGRSHTCPPEVKEQASARLKALWQQPEYRQTMSAMLKGRAFSLETKKKMSESAKLAVAAGRKVSPKYWLGKKGKDHCRFGKKPTYPLPRFVEDLGHAVRSSLEEKGLRILKTKGVQYKYEQPYPIQFADGSHYNFYVDTTLDATHVLEFKGYPRKFDFVKLALFKQQYPNIHLTLVTYPEFVPQFTSKYCDKVTTVNSL